VPASIVQINVSRGGVPKRPIAEALVTTLGLAGDEHAHPEIHGGPLQALLIVTAEGIDELIAQGFPLFAGALGENITTRGLDRRALRMGQRYRTPYVIFELTKPRAPCEQLHIYGSGIQKAVYDPLVRAGDPSSPRWGLSGFYASVIEPGPMRPGEPVVLLEELA
jgi:MOSC domain-containing protein YiiM